MSFALYKTPWYNKAMKNLTSKSLEFSKFYFSKPVSVVLVSAYAYILVLVVSILGVNAMIKHFSKDSVEVPTLGEVSTSTPTNAPIGTPSNTENQISNTSSPKKPITNISTDKKSNSNSNPSDNSSSTTAPSEDISKNDQPETETIISTRLVPVTQPVSNPSKSTTNTQKNTEKTKPEPEKESYENQNAPKTFSNPCGNTCYNFNYDNSEAYNNSVIEAKNAAATILNENPNITRGEMIAALYNINPEWTWFIISPAISDLNLPEDSEEPEDTSSDQEESPAGTPEE